MFKRNNLFYCKRKWGGIFKRKPEKNIYQEQMFIYKNIGDIMAYLKRYIEEQIKEALETSGAIVVAGPKFCCKTTTCELFGKSKYTLDTLSKIRMVEANPETILIGDNPRLIDEWQNVPHLWNCVRSEIDHRDNKFGQFIFAGSSTPAEKTIFIILAPGE